VASAVNDRREIFDNDGGLFWNHERPLGCAPFANNKCRSVQSLSTCQPALRQFFENRAETLQTWDARKNRFE
jgi:hypothetical protein